MTYFQTAELMGKYRRVALQGAKHTFPSKKRSHTVNDVLNYGNVILHKRFNETEGATDRDLKVISYLARNEGADIVFDSNVSHAWEMAIRALVDAHDDYSRKRGKGANEHLD